MKKWAIWLIHALFWSTLLYYLTFFRVGSTWRIGLIYAGVFGVVNISAFYFNLLIVLPYLLRPRRFWWLPLAWAAMIVGYAAMRNYLSLALAPYVPPPYRIYIGFMATLRQSIFITGFVVFISTVYKLAEDWLMHQRIRSILEKENLRSELLFLRSQINPHFLFNTLNNIYSLAYQKSDLAPGAIARLSTLMRYMLSENMDTEVPLNEELEYLKDFIALQALRVRNGLEMQLEISGDAERCAIAPLLLINFLENAFKHGVLNDRDHPIVMKVTVLNEQMDFYLSNQLAPGSPDPHKGIGLKNVQRRLDLLYPRRHTLKISETNDRYTVELGLTAKPVS